MDISVKSLIYFCCFIVWLPVFGMDNFFKMKKLFKKRSVVSKAEKNLFEAMANKNDKDVVMLLKKHKKLRVTKDLLIKTRFQLDPKNLLVRFENRQIAWKGVNPFYGFNDDTIKVLIDSMDKKDITNNYILKALILKSDPKLLGYFLERFKKNGGDLNCRTKNVGEMSGLACVEDGLLDFIVAYDDRRRFQPGFMAKSISSRKMLKLLFKYKLSVKDTYLRPFSYFNKKCNGFEAYFNRGKYSSLLVDRLKEESLKKGLIAKLFLLLQGNSILFGKAADEERIKNIKLLSLKLDSSSFIKSPFSGVLESPVEYALANKRFDCAKILLDKYFFYNSEKIKEDSQELNVILSEVICNGKIDLAHNIIDRGVIVSKDTLKEGFRKNDFVNCLFLEKLLKFSNVELNPSIYYAIFNTILGKSDNKKLIDVLKKKNILDLSVVKLIQKNMDICVTGARYPARFKQFECLKALDHLEDIDALGENNMSIFSRALCALNLDMLRHLQQKGANIEQSVKLLRSKFNIVNKDKMKRFISEEELESYHTSIYKRKSDKNKMKLSVDLVNKHLKKNDFKGFIYNNKRDKSEIAFKVSRQRLKSLYDTKVITKL